MKEKIEAILFAAGEPVEMNKLAGFLKLKKAELEKLVEELSLEYERKKGLQIIAKSNKIQMVSHPEQGESVRGFLNREINDPLSKAALEVLAVVAYRGPVTRAEIEYIRGVNCSFTLRNLAMRGLIEKKDNPADSRSFVYLPSFDFLKSLGLKKIEDLPAYEKMKKVKS